mmetsp:Transcript_21890/g.45599  ORF Transcript_21890/g.45599 Transcript_21890/m.45599 type:complete len:230 (+) Transcript_21890:62-751(+)
MEGRKGWRRRLESLLPPPPPVSLIAPFLSLLLFRFVTSSTYSSTIPTYHSVRYGIPRSKLGYYSSYGSVISLFTNLGVLRYAMSTSTNVLVRLGYVPDTLNIVTVAIGASVVAQVAELVLAEDGEPWFNVLFTLPVYTVGYAMSATAIKTELNISSKREGCVGRTLGTLDVALNFVGVVVPVWRVVIFGFLGEGEGMERRFGWVIVAHWVVGLVGLRLIKMAGEKIKGD